MLPRHAWLRAERLKRPWLLIPALITFFAAHLLWFHYLASRAAVSTAFVAGVVAMIVIKHLGLLGPAYAAVVRYVRRRRD